MKGIKERLKENPPAEQVKNFNGADYLPIGQIEETLDELFYSWSTTDFKFQIIRTDKYWFADASVTLITVLNDAEIKAVTGAVTFQISSQDVNMDYSGTALSYATANAAKKLGRRFGRALNNRLTKGDILPIIQLRAEQEKEADDEVIQRFIAIKERLLKTKSYEEAKALLEADKEWKVHPDLKNIVTKKLIT